MSLTISVVQAEVALTPEGALATAVKIDLDVLNCLTTHQVVGGAYTLDAASGKFKSGEFTRQVHVALAARLTLAHASHSRRSWWPHGLGDRRLYSRHKDG